MEDVISAIDCLSKAERQRLLTDEELLTNLSVSLKRKTTSQIASRLLSDTLKATLATWSWSKEERRQLGLTIPIRVYLKDPTLAMAEPELAPQPIDINWEPGLADGPTSARVAVVDVDTTKNQVVPAARWDQNRWGWVMPLEEGKEASPEPVPSRFDCPQFRQVNVWAVIERVSRISKSFDAFVRANDGYDEATLTALEWNEVYVERVKWTQQKRAAAYENLGMLIRKQAISYPFYPELIAELDVFKSDLTFSGVPDYSLQIAQQSAVEALCLVTYDISPEQPLSWVPSREPQPRYYFDEYSQEWVQLW